MLWVIQVSVVSLIIIFVLHNLYSFFKETLTVPKIKDMVKRPQQKYEMLFRELRNQSTENPNSSTSNSKMNSSFNNSNSNSAADEMKNELKRYLMDLNSSSQLQYPQPQSDFIELGSTYQ